MKIKESHDVDHSRSENIAGEFPIKGNAESKIASTNSGEYQKAEDYLYHYTKGCHLPKIVREGVIKQSTSFLDKKEKPAVWLTTCPEWEVGCNSGLIKNPDFSKSPIGKYYYCGKLDFVTAPNEFMKRNIGMCRILVNKNIPTVTWRKFKWVSGISEIYYNSLDRIHKLEGSPVEKWRISFKELPRKQWQGIEMYVQDQWVRWDEKVPIGEFVSLCLSCNQKERNF